MALQIEIVDFRDRFVIGPVGIEDHAPTIIEVRPIDFGAAGDGVTDDYKPLQETVSYALANHLPINPCPSELCVQPNALHQSASVE